VIEVDIKNEYDASEYANLESYLAPRGSGDSSLPDPRRGPPKYDPSVTTAEAIMGLSGQCESMSPHCSKVSLSFFLNLGGSKL
jgi:hypothetical protein